MEPTSIRRVEGPSTDSACSLASRGSQVACLSRVPPAPYTYARSNTVTGQVYDVVILSGYAPLARDRDSNRARRSARPREAGQAGDGPHGVPRDRVHPRAPGHPRVLASAGCARGFTMT